MISVIPKINSIGTNITSRNSTVSVNLMEETFLKAVIIGDSFFSIVAVVAVSSIIV
jgi:hypothetical protein